MVTMDDIREQREKVAVLFDRMLDSPDRHNREYYQSPEYLELLAAAVKLDEMMREIYK